MILKEPETHKNIEIQCTDVQKEAIFYPVKPNTLLNIIAGPGSGKTKTLCDRILYLLSEEGPNIKASEIIVLSLTNKSVQDIKEKLQFLAGYEISSQIPVHTFHSFASSFAKEKYPKWKLLGDDNIKQFRTVINSLNKNQKFDNHSLEDTIRKIRDVTVADLEATSNESITNEYYFNKATLIKLKILTGDDVFLTFDDLITEGFNVIKNENRNLSFNVLLIDEFQDVDSDLMELIQYISKNKHITVAGDHEQSIFEFKGAYPEKNWGELLPLYDKDSKKTVILDQTFRFSPYLLKLSRNILGSEHNLVSQCVPSETHLLPVRESFDNLFTEIEFIHEEIKRLIKLSDGKIKASDIAILSYTNKHLTEIEQIFKIKGELKTSNVEKSKFPDNEHATFLLYLRLLQDPKQNFAFLASLNTLKGIGPAKMNDLYNLSKDYNKSVYDCLLDKNIPKPPLLMKNVKPLLDFLANVEISLDRNDPYSIMLSLLSMTDQLGYKQTIFADATNIKTGKYKDWLNSIFKSLKEMSLVKEKDEDLLSFYGKFYNGNHLLLQSQEFDKINNMDNSVVTLSTIHKAKGLEFPIVFLLSHVYEVSRPSNKELYVGATRAKNLLYFNKNDFLCVPYIDRLPNLDEENKIGISKNNNNFPWMMNHNIKANDLKILPTFSLQAPGLDSSGESVKRLLINMGRLPRSSPTLKKSVASLANILKNLA